MQRATRQLPHHAYGEVPGAPHPAHVATSGKDPRLTSIIDDPTRPVAPAIPAWDRRAGRGEQATSRCSQSAPEPVAPATPAEALSPPDGRRRSWRWAESRRTQGVAGPRRPRRSRPGAGTRRARNPAPHRRRCMPRRDPVRPREHEGRWPRDPPKHEPVCGLDCGRLLRTTRQARRRSPGLSFTPCVLVAN
jgi:hypothetical protein